MKIFITGGCGYIGSAVSKYLLENKLATSITIFDNFSSNNKAFLANNGLENLKVVKGDILDSRTLKKNMANHDAVIHLAEVKDASMPHYMEQVNNWGTAEVSFAVENLKIPRFVFLSSSKVYPYTFGEELLVGVDKVSPISAYSTSKLRGEEHVARLFDRNVLNTHIIRVASVFGASPSLTFDTHINKLMFDAHYFNRIELYGTGFQIRPFVHIDNVVSSIVGLLKSDVKCQTHNLATHNLSSIDLIDSLKEVYQDMEFIFTSHHLSLPHLRLQVSESLEAYIKNTKSISETISEMKDHLAPQG